MKADPERAKRSMLAWVRKHARKHMPKGTKVKYLLKDDVHGKPLIVGIVRRDGWEGSFGVEVGEFMKGAAWVKLALEVRIEDMFRHMMAKVEA